METIWLELTLPYTGRGTPLKVRWQWRGSGPHSNGTAGSTEDAVADAWRAFEVWEASRGQVPA